MATTSALRFQGSHEEFYTELRYFMTEAADKPEYFFQSGSVIYREANLRRFPYHFLFLRRCPRSPNSRRPPSPSISIFWTQTSIGVWPSLKSVAWRGLGFYYGH